MDVTIKTRPTLSAMTRCLCLVVLLSLPVLRLGAVAEAQTINDLLKSGGLDSSYSEDGVLPEPPGEKPPDEPPSPKTGADSGVPPAIPEPLPEPGSVAPPATAVPPAAVKTAFADRIIRIGRPPYISTKGISLAVRGLLTYLKEELGAKDVQLVTPKDYDGVLRALDQRSVDFAWLGPTSYVIGLKKTSMMPLAKAKRRTGGTYRGLIVARKDSGIKTLAEIKGKTIGFVDPESASGYLYPLQVLLQAGIDPRRDCARIEFLQKHDALMSAVWTKKIDVGAVIEDTIATVKDQKVLDQLVILGKTGEIPTDIVACRADCDPELRNAFQKALLKTASLKQAVSSVTGLPPIMEFLPVDQADIDGVQTFLNGLEEARKP